jgi:hypothetical protein
MTQYLEDILGGGVFGDEVIRSKEFCVALVRPAHASRPSRRKKACVLGPRDSVADLRDRVLRHLVNLGTETSVEVLRKVVGLLRNREWLA